jgi:FkbM family methyltransferase
MMNGTSNKRADLEYAIAYAAEQKTYSPIECCRMHRNICVFGCGKYLADLVENRDILNYLGATMLSDSDKAKHGKTLYGLPVLPPEELYDLTDLVVVFCLGNSYPLFERFEDINAFKFQMHDVVMEYDVPNAKIEFDRNAIRAVYGFLADDLSREAYVNELLFKCAGKPRGREAASRDRFGYGFLRLTQNESFVECGSFHGYEIGEFIKAVNNGFESIVGFEPSHDAYEGLLRKYDDSRISFRNVAVGDRAETAYLDVLNLTGAIIRSSVPAFGQQCRTVRLDDEIQRCSFLAMNIEGSEAAAIRGGGGMISRNRPKIMLDLNHKFQDCWELPLLLKSIVPDYRIFIRTYKTKPAENGKLQFLFNTMYAIVQ